MMYYVYNIFWLQKKGFGN